MDSLEQFSNNVRWTAAEKKESKQRRGRRKLTETRDTYTSDEEGEQTKKDQDQEQHDPRGNLSNSPYVPGIQF